MCLSDLVLLGLTRVNTTSLPGNGGTPNRQMLGQNERRIHLAVSSNGPAIIRPGVPENLSDGLSGWPVTGSAGVVPQFSWHDAGYLVCGPWSFYSDDPANVVTVAETVLTDDGYAIYCEWKRRKMEEYKAILPKPAPPVPAPPVGIPVVGGTPDPRPWRTNPNRP